MLKLPKLPKLPRLPGLPRVPKLPLLIVAIGVVGGGGLVMLQRLGQVQELQRRLTAKEARAAQLEAQNGELSQRLGSLEQERAAFEKERGALDKRLASLRDALSAAADDLTKSRTEFEVLQAKVDQLDKDRADLKAQVTTLTSERDAAAQRAASLAQDKQDLARSVERWHGRFTLLEREQQQLSEKLKQLETAPGSYLNAVTLLEEPPGPADAPVPSPSSAWPSDASPSDLSSAAASPPMALTPQLVELLPVAVSASAAGILHALDGRLLAVNDTQGFVVIDKGARDGVTIGMRVDIHRGNKAVGRATVVSVRPQLSACNIVRPETPEPLQVGDLAVLRGS